VFTTTGAHIDCVEKNYLFSNKLPTNTGTDFIFGTGLNSQGEELADLEGLGSIVSYQWNLVPRPGCQQIFKKEFLQLPENPSFRVNMKLELRNCF